MKLNILLIILVAFQFTVGAQDTKQLHETAKAFMRQGDYPNAVLVLNRGLQADPGNIPMAKDLSLCYYLQKDNIKALETVKPLLENEGADDQCYQIAGNVYKELNQLKECEKLYKKGIRKFPESGALYNDMGELLWAQRDYEAIRYWEKGIETDPAYSKNYYNAARYYYLTTDKIWSIFYGEIFVNMEPLNPGTAEVKELLLNGYKKLFADATIAPVAKEKNEFTKMFLQNMNRQSSLAVNGINVESLIMIRTRFILDWNSSAKEKFPHKLFEYQQQLLQEGMFEAYNQWMFGSSQDLIAFQGWNQAHSLEYKLFINFQKSRLFKIPSGQYYH